MAWSTIADLPTEVLLLVLQYLHTHDILTLGKLSRRLNSVAIPLVLHKKGFAHPQNSAIFNLQDHERYGDALAALSLNFSITDVKHLVFVLDTSEASTKLIHRINHVISRLSSINSLRLVLRSVGGTWSLRSEFVVEFIGAFLKLLQTALLKSCDSLQIVHTHPFSIETNHVFQVLHRRTPSMPPIIIKLVKILKGCIHRGRPFTDELQGHDWRYHQVSADPPSRAPALPIIGPKQSKLSNLDLNSDFLLVPPFSAWTVRLMNCSHITSLSLSLSRSITLEEFRHFLFPKVVEVLPLLEEIKISFPRDEFLTTVVDNLHRLRSLRKITFALADFGNLPPVSTHTPLAVLSNLIAFTGSLAQAAYLFAGPIACPNLASLNIVMDPYFWDNWNPVGTVKSFSILRKRFLTLGISPCISVCLSNMEPPQLPSSPKTSEGDSEMAKSLLIVSRLNLTLPAFFVDKAEAEHQAVYALAWLSVFRGVQELTLLARTPVSDVSAREERDSVLRATISAQWPNIKSINVIDLLSDEYHAHWSNFHDDFTRGIDGLHSITLLKNKTASPCICSDF